VNQRLLQLHLTLARHRWLAAGLTLALAAASFWAVSRLRLSEDFTDMLPLSDPTVARQIEALHWVRQADRLYLDVSAPAPDAELLATAADRLCDALAQIPDLGDIRCRIDEAAAGDVLLRLQTETPELLRAGDEAVLAQRIDPAAIRQRLEWLKRSLSQPQGMALKAVLSSDPIGIGDLVSTRLRDLQVNTGSGHVADGRLTSADGRHLLVSVAPAFPSSDHRRSAALVEAVLQAARDVEGEFADRDVCVAVTGAHRIALDNAILIREDLGRITGIVALGVAIVMMTAFRRRWLALLCLAPTALGVLVAGAVFTLSGDTVSAIALGCGSCLVGVLVDCAVHVVYHIDETRPSNPHQLAAEMARLTPAIALAGLTTVAAFTIMLGSPTAGHRQLGLFAAVGAAVSAAAALTVLPLCIPLRQPNAPAGTADNRPARLPLTRLLEPVVRWRAGANRSAWILTLALSALALIGLTRFHFENDLSRLNGVRPETAADDRLINLTWGESLALTTIVVPASTWDQALALNERVFEALQPLQASGVIHSLASVARSSPSSATRNEARARWRAFWDDTRRAQVRRTLETSAEELGFRPGVFEPFLASLEAPSSSRPASGEAPWLLRESWLQDYWNQAGGRVALLTFAKLGSPSGCGLLEQALARQAPGALLLNKQALGDRLTRLTQRSLITFAVLALGVNAALLFLLLQRVRLVLIALIPILAGNFWTLGALGLAGHSLNFANLVFVVFVAGVSLDYCMFLMLARLDLLRGERDREASAAASVVLCALTTLAGVGALAFARHPALFSVGVTALAGISLCLVATQLLVPTLMDHFARNHES